MILLIFPRSTCRIICWKPSRSTFPPEKPLSTNVTIFSAFSSGFIIDLQYSSCVSHEILFSRSIDFRAYKAIDIRFHLLPLRLLGFYLFKKILYSSSTISFSACSFSSSVRRTVLIILYVLFFESVYSDTYINLPCKFYAPKACTYIEPHIGISLLSNPKVSFVIELNNTEFELMSWNDFVSGIHDEELINYLKSKRLYINEILKSIIKK